MFNKIALPLTVLFILWLWIAAAIQMQNYNDTCYAKIDGHKYLLCYE